LQCCSIGCAVKCKIYPAFEIYNAVTMFKTIFISSFCILNILKMLVKALNCSTLISVGSCFLLCVLAKYVFTVSSCVWVRNAVEKERTPFLLLKQHRDIMWSLMSCTLHQILFMRSNRDEWDERGLQHVGWRGEVRTGFWWGNLRERDHLEDSGVDGRTIIRWIFRKWDVGHGQD
jgi:hypothetical protein